MFIADIACINSHSGSESCAAPVLYVHCWHCMYELSSRKWVMCSSCAWFPIADIVWMNSHPASESYAAPVLDFLLLILLSWTPIQGVSHVQLLCLISIIDIACIKCHPVCESCATSVLYFHCWHCLHELSFSLWVMCSSCALFPLLILPAWTLIQFVSHVQLMCLISTADITCMNYHPLSELCAAHMLDFHCWHCLHKLSSREWVMSASVLNFCCWHYLHELPSRQWDMCCSCAAGCVLFFHCWYCIHELLSRKWVIGSLWASFPLLIFHC